MNSSPVARSDEFTSMFKAIDREVSESLPTPSNPPVSTTPNLEVMGHESHQGSDGGSAKMERYFDKVRDSAMHAPSEFPANPDPTASHSSNRSIEPRSSSKAHSVLSSEGDWLAGTLDYPELPSSESEIEPMALPQRAANSKAHQRRCQIVGHSLNSRFGDAERRIRQDNKALIVSYNINEYNILLSILTMFLGICDRSFNYRSEIGNHLSNSIHSSGEKFSIHVH
jgi:hypothetical protein